MSYGITPHVLATLQTEFGPPPAAPDSKSAAAAAAAASAAVDAKRASEGWGYLIGVTDETNAQHTHVINIIRHGTALGEGDLRHALASGVSPVGVFFPAAASGSAESAARSFIASNEQRIAHLFTDTNAPSTAAAADSDSKNATASAAATSALIAVVDRTQPTAVSVQYLLYTASDKSLKPITVDSSAAAAVPLYDSATTSLTGTRLLFRARFDRVLYYRHSDSDSNFSSAALRSEFSELQRSLLSDAASPLAFHFKQTDTLFSSIAAAAAADTTCADLQTADAKSASGGGGGKSKKGGKATKGVVTSARFEDSAIECALFVNASAAASGAVITPVVVYEPGVVRSVRLSFDVLMHASAAAPVSALIDSLIAQLRRQLNRMQTIACAEATAATTPSWDAIHVRAYHFKPSAYPHTATVVYPVRADAAKADSLLPVRRELHYQLCVPPTRPVFRPACAVQWGSSGSDESGRLYNVHRSLSASSGAVSGGRVSCVDGRYVYHHYMQDKFDDKGWGCAYRTFQTVMSWFRCQHYIPSDSPLPTHLQVQTCLVEMKEKSAGFAGSREWIGAIELGLVIDHMYGLTAKILPVPSGSEVAGIARHLAHHFDTAGTPIMIGGGQLAYGLLGVDYNPSTGDVRFLILDPHYTGTEDISTIISKGWCGWKDSSLFLPNAFYNFCMPQRPTVI